MYSLSSVVLVQKTVTENKVSVAILEVQVLDNEDYST